MSSSKSNHLCHVSANLQRSPRKRGFGQVEGLNILKAKRRCLEFKTRTTREENSQDVIVSSTLCEPSFELVSDLGSEQNEVEISRGLSYKHNVKSTNIDSFRREIRIELLEILDLMDEIDGVRSIIDGEFECRCTLEIFLGEYENLGGRRQLICGEDVWRSQQICSIRTTCDDFGHSTSKLIMPKPFLIQAEDLLIRKRSKGTRVGLSNQYVVKAWLEAPGTQYRWPPLELESTLDPHGRIMTSIHEGALSSTAMRLMGKGVLFPEEGTYDKLGLILKLGDFRVRTNYALRIDVRYSIPPKFGMPLNTPQLHAEKTLDKPKFMAKSLVSAVGLEPIIPPDLHSIDISVKEQEISDTRKQRHTSLQRLTVPSTKKRLCGDVVKNILTAGEELDPIDDEVETKWQITSHLEMMRDIPDITNTMKEYIAKWNLHIYPLQLSCNLYLPQVLLGFVKENITWFGEDSRRVREFSLHATSLRLRGSINIECFAKCIDFLRNCTKTHTKLVKLKSTDIQITDHPLGDDFHSKHSTDVSAVDQKALNEKHELGRLNIYHTDKSRRNTEAADAGAVWEEALDLEPPFENSLNDGAAYEERVLQNISDQESEREEEIRQLGVDGNHEYAEVDETFEDASEELDDPTLEDFFDAQDGLIILEQPFYLHSYWQRIIKRWPRLKLHGPYSFGVASMLAAIAIFQGFPDDNIDRLIALYIHYCPNENIKDLINMYFNATEVVPKVEGVCMTELKLHRIMWEASRETCEYWLTDVYRLEGGTRTTVHEAIETAMNGKAWDELWECVSSRCG